MKDDKNHLASDYNHKCLLESVSQGAATPRTQDTKHRANHSDATLFLSKHTHKHRANHSSVILLGSTSEEADLPIVVNRLTLAKHYQLSNKHVS